MSIEADHSSAKAAETITNLRLFMKEAPRELGLSWAAFVVLGALASPGISYLSTPEILQSTGLNRGWGYKNIRMLLRKALIDSVVQRGPRNQVRALYSLNGKGAFYLTHALLPNGVSIIKALERSNK